MSIFYATEHLTCYNYVATALSTFKVFTYPKTDTEYVFNIDRPVILFFIYGQAKASYAEGMYLDCQSNHLYLLPRGVKCHLQVEEDCRVMTCAFIQNYDFCNCFSFNALKPFMPNDYKFHYSALKMSERIEEYTSYMLKCMGDLIMCAPFHDMKARELFHLLRFYYTKEQLADFFYPLLSSKMDFKDVILSNYRSFPSVEEFANMNNMSVSTFNRTFKDNFGIPAHQWLLQRKAECIYREIITTDKPLADIASEYGMANANYLTKFCRTYFSMAPNEIRKTDGVAAH